jgi:hypothetical protein
MTILFNLDHPAHVHLFRDFIVYLLQQGYQVLVTSQQKDVTQVLLDHYQIPHIPLSKYGSGPPASWPKNMDTKWFQEENPLAWRSVLVYFTAFPNLYLEKVCSI